MAVFLSHEDRARLVQILKAVNPLTAAAYGPQLDSWLGYSLVVGEAKSIDALVLILRAVNPPTVAAYGPALDMWAALAKIMANDESRLVLAQVLRTVNPMTAAAYGPLLDAWAAVWRRTRRAPYPGKPLLV